MSRVVAAVDCGTNSTRLLVVDEASKTLARRMTITRLGEGVDRTGHLAEAAVARTVEVLGRYRVEMDELGVTAVRVTATSAVRDAANAAQFAAEVVRVVGVSPEVLSGDEEGRLTYRGASAGLEGTFLVVDVGGGSTELVTETVARSLDIGCVRATERFLQHDPPEAGEVAAARAFVGGLVASVAPELTPATRMLGVAGTVAALTAIDLGGYDHEQVNGARLTRATVERLLAELARVPVAVRRTVVGLEPERADVIVGGAAVLAEVMGVLGYDELTSLESDILDGVAAELLESSGGSA